MRIFKNMWFSRYAAKEGIQDNELRDIVNVLESGQAEANLGGGVYKVRLARSGEGKSGGYRIIVVFRSGDRTFFRYGFAKSSRAAISEKEERNHKRTAKVLLSLNDEQLDALVKTGYHTEL
ncbi:MAG: type II toxin-antitoxin system RelE/ParE family toxin [Treponema sp.]|jgi:hypothetical protein|nr:type II toxin-antitoxin system RelE/ParE family toxin [Treponema sp.]